MTRRRARCGWGLAMVAVGVLAAACTRAPTTQKSTDLRAEVARLQRTSALLQRQIDLADEKEFYLVIDPAGSEVSLMLRGAQLQRYPVLGLQIGHPRVSWVGRHDPRPWQGTTWLNGKLDPPRQIDRLVIQAAPPGKDVAEPEPAVIPPTAEELYPVPTRYHIRFAGGLSLEIRPREADANAGRWARLWASWSAKWRDVASAVLARDRDAVRLRMAMNPKDAESLYRSLPPAVRLIVLAGRPDAPADSK